MIAPCLAGVLKDSKCAEDSVVLRARMSPSKENLFRRVRLTEKYMRK